jgi:hypothetical protein
VEHAQCHLSHWAADPAAGPLIRVAIIWLSVEWRVRPTSVLDAATGCLFKEEPEVMIDSLKDFEGAVTECEV